MSNISIRESPCRALGLASICIGIRESVRWAFVDTSVIVEELASWATETVVVGWTVAIGASGVAFVAGVGVDIGEQAGGHGTLGNTLARIVLGEHIGLIRARRALVRIWSGALTAKVVARQNGEAVIADTPRLIVSRLVQIGLEGDRHFRVGVVEVKADHLREIVIALS